MSLTSGLQIEGLKYAKAILDTVRRMSADTLGVTRQGYSELETMCCIICRAWVEIWIWKFTVMTRATCG